MEFLVNVLVFLHLVAFAGVLGGFLVQVRADERRILPLQWHGILTQVVTGVLLAGIVPGADDLGDDDAARFHAKVGVKLVVALVVLVLVAVNRKKATISTGVWAAIGVLELVNVALALFWAVG